MAVTIKGRYLGIAVFKDADLIDWRIRRFKKKNIGVSESVEQAVSITAKSIDSFEPEIVALEDSCYKRKENSYSARIPKRIREQARKKKHALRFIDPASVRKFLCRETKATKMNVAMKIATHYYPWLYWRYEVDKKKPWYEKPYHQVLFDAIALGMYCQHFYRKMK